jgi:hypothetical protein
MMVIYNRYVVVVVVVAAAAIGAVSYSTIEKQHLIRLWAKLTRSSQGKLAYINMFFFFFLLFFLNDLVINLFARFDSI